MTEEEMKAKIANLEAEKAALKNKNSELIDREKSALSKAEKAERDREEAAENASNANSTELEKATKRAEKAERELQASNERAAQLESTRRNERADALIAKALNSANVDGKHTSLLSKALRADVQFSDDGDPLIDGKSVEDFAKGYFGNKGDGYGYVRAANNSGGAASGHDGSKALRMNKDNFTNAGFIKIQMEDPAEANAIADAIGRPELKVDL